MEASKGEGGKEEDGDLRLQLFLGRAAPVPESTAPLPHRRVGRGQESKLDRFVFHFKSFRQAVCSRFIWAADLVSR